MFRVEEGVSGGVRFHRLWVADRFVEIPEDASPGIVLIQITRLRNFCEEAFTETETAKSIYSHSIPEPIKTGDSVVITGVTGAMRINGTYTITATGPLKTKPRKKKGRKRCVTNDPNF